MQGSRDGRVDAVGGDGRSGGDELWESERRGESCSLVVLFELRAVGQRLLEIQAKGERVTTAQGREIERVKLTIFLAASSLTIWNRLISNSSTLSLMNFSSAVLLFLFRIRFANPLAAICSTNHPSFSSAPSTVRSPRSHSR